MLHCCLPLPRFTALILVNLPGSFAWITMIEILLLGLDNARWNDRK